MHFFLKCVFLFVIFGICNQGSLCASNDNGELRDSQEPLGIKSTLQGKISPKQKQLSIKDCFNRSPVTKPAESSQAQKSLKRKPSDSDLRKEPFKKGKQDLTKKGAERGREEAGSPSSAEASPPDIALPLVMQSPVSLASEKEGNQETPARNSHPKAKKTLRFGSSKSEVSASEDDLPSTILSSPPSPEIQSLSISKGKDELGCSQSRGTKRNNSSLSSCSGKQYKQSKKRHVSYSSDDGDENNTDDSDEDKSLSESENDKFLSSAKVVLLKESVMSFKDALLAEKVLKERGVSGPHNIEIGIDLYVQKKIIKAPSWIDVFKEHVEEDVFSTTVGNQIKAGILFVEKSHRKFAFLFQGGRSLLRDDVVEERFGLHATLNSLNPRKVRALGTETASTNSRRTNTRFQFETSIAQFPRDGILKNISGKHKRSDYLIATSLSGTDVIIRKPIRIEELPSLCDALLASASSDAYKKHYPWVDHLRFISEKPLLARLDQALVEAMREGKKASEWNLAEPLEDTHLEDEHSIDSYRVNRSQTNLKSIEEVFSLLKSSFRKKLSKEVGVIALTKFLKRTQVYGLDGEGDKKSRWSFYKAISFETMVDGEIYVLSSGKWFKVAPDYNNTVSGFIDSLTSPLYLPPILEAEEEVDYNKRIVSSDPDSFLFLDRRNVMLEGDPIEVCDVLSIQRELIAVKRGTASAALSHLFAQANISSLSLLQDVEFRRNFRKKFLRAELIAMCRKLYNEFHKMEEKDKDPKNRNEEEKTRHNLFETLAERLNATSKKDEAELERASLCEEFVSIAGERLPSIGINLDNLLDELSKKEKLFDSIFSVNNFNPKKYTYVYVITTDKENGPLSEILPFFSRLNLKLHAEAIGSHGYNVAVKVVKVVKDKSASSKISKGIKGKGKAKASKGTKSKGKAKPRKGVRGKGRIKASRSTPAKSAQNKKGENPKEEGNKGAKKEGKQSEAWEPGEDGFLRMKASSDVPLVTVEGKKFYEYWQSGGGHNCALYCLGFKDRGAALHVLLESAKKPQIRKLIVPEIRADLAQGRINSASSFIAKSPEYKAFLDRAEKVTKDLNAEVQRLRQTREHEFKGTPTQEELEESFKIEDLVAYHKLIEDKSQADIALEDYLSSEEIFRGFVTYALKGDAMISYLPGNAGATSIMSALARALECNLIIYAKNLTGKLFVVHQYDWDPSKPKRILLHTRYKDSKRELLLGGDPGTLTNNRWNHFNLLHEERITQRKWVEGPVPHDLENVETDFSQASASISSSQPKTRSESEKSESNGDGLEDDESKERIERDAEKEQGKDTHQEGTV